MTATGLTDTRHKALAAFFRAHQRDLERVVSSRARSVGPEAILDACAFAWLKLVRRPDILLDRDGFAWLATVAIHEAWRAQRESREIPYGTLSSDRYDDGELSDQLGLASDPLDRVLATELHHERVARFAGLKPRERRDLLLLAGGYKYHEIAKLSRGVRVNVAGVAGRGRWRHVGDGGVAAAVRGNE
jgi:DNA-directed RNA polymerase specialized sigma24 family protein